MIIAITRNNYAYSTVTDYYLKWTARVVNLHYYSMNMYLALISTQMTFLQPVSAAA